MNLANTITEREQQAGDRQEKGIVRNVAQFLDLLAALERPLPGEEIRALEVILPADAICKAQVLEIRR